MKTDQTLTGRPGTWASKRGGPLLSLSLLAALLLLPACRDATAPFVSDDRLDGSATTPRQLTFSTEDDRAPTWSASSDSLMYVTVGFSPFAPTPGLLLKLPSNGGGAAETLLPRLQTLTGSRQWLSTPVPSPDGTRLAFAEFRNIRAPVPCAGTISCTPSGSFWEMPALGELTLRIVEQDGSLPPLDGPQLSVAFDGLDVFAEFLPARFVVTFHPFHHLFQLDRSLVFRPTWAPDGSAVAYSDGLRLLLWDGVAESGVPIPGTEQGVSPAWSPDGEWIAFTRLVPGAPLLSSCSHTGVLGTNCTQERVTYPVLNRLVTLVRPDGSEFRELWQGEEVAWTPDGGSLVFRRANQLWIGGIDGGNLLPLPQTEGARDPAVSPDGTHLAYSQPGPGGALNLWVRRMN